MKAFFCELIFLLIFITDLGASDWPMWRYNASRTSASPDNIAENPKLLWSRKLPATRPAWPMAKDNRSNFDDSYEPVVMGGTMFIGSPNNGSITAYDTGTGSEKWQIFTNGPVRCALASWNGKVYAGSDDGYLYCLNAETGKLLWKFRGAPKDRPERRIMGNEHLISFWPVRGGPVVKDGTVCFGAGIWPIFGVFIYALDAETGEVKWKREDLNYISNVRSDHDNFIQTGLSPQGNFVAAGDKLVIPCGRSMPAGLNFKTGKLIYFTQGYYGGGSCHVSAYKDYAFVGARAVLNMYDFRELGSKWAYRGLNPPENYAEMAKKGKYNIPRDLFECPAIPYNLINGCNSWSAFSNEVAYGSSKGTFYAYDIKNAERFEREYKWGRKTFHPLTWKPKLLWEFKAPGAGRCSNLIIKAGKRVYGYARKKLIALDNLTGPPVIAWRKEVIGTPSSLLAADKKLFVVTKEGWIHCFGDGDKGETYDGNPIVLEKNSDDLKDKAKTILSSTPLKSGYCVIQGIKDAKLLEEIIKQSKLIVIGIDEDSNKINSLKKYFTKAGLLGSRVELFTGKPFDFILPPYMASLMLSEKPISLKFLTKKFMKTNFQILHPYGGTLCLDMDQITRCEFKAKVKLANLENAELKENGDSVSLTREGALPNSAPWTHDGCDAANTLCSQDDLLKAPLGILWFGDQNACPQDVHAVHKVTTKVNGGRVYVLQQKRPRALFAYDAYTGFPLWKIDFKSFFTAYAAMDDGIYLATDGKCFVYDPESGKKLKTFNFGTEQASRVQGIRVDGDFIIIFCDAANKTLEKKIVGRANDLSWKKSVSYSSTLVCLDRKTGKELWRREAKKRYMNGAFALDDGIVYFVDTNPLPAKRPPKKTEFINESDIHAIELRSGREKWSKKIHYKYFGWSHGPDWIKLSREGGVILTGRYKLVNALDLKTGELLWGNKDFGYALPIMVNGKELILQTGAIIDASTGKRLRSFRRENRFGCNYAIANKNIVLVRRNSAGYIDLKNGKNYALRNIRAGCQNNLIPGDGLLSAPNFSMVCGCGYAIRTSFAMIHMPEVDKWSGKTPIKLTPPPARPDMEAKIRKFNVEIPKEKIKLNK